MFLHSESRKEEKEEKKEIIQFKNKKEAIEAFKMLLKDKVSIMESIFPKNIAVRYINDECFGSRCRLFHKHVEN